MSEIGRDIGNTSTPLSTLLDCVADYDVLRKQLKEKADEVNREVEELKARVHAMTMRQETAERNSIVGQVYFTFQESVIHAVFDGRNVPVYTIQEIEEVLVEDSSYNDEDDVFKSQEEKMNAQSKWDHLQVQLGWKGLEDLNALEYLERWRYGYTKPRLTVLELDEALCDAKKSTWFKDKATVIQLFDRYIQMCRKLEDLRL